MTLEIDSLSKQHIKKCFEKEINDGFAGKWRVSSPFSSLRSNSILKGSHISPQDIIKPNNPHFIVGCDWIPAVKIWNPVDVDLQHRSWQIGLKILIIQVSEFIKKIQIKSKQLHVASGML